jgi:hypothetical protein
VPSTLAVDFGGHSVGTALVECRRPYRPGTTPRRRLRQLARANTPRAADVLRPCRRRRSSDDDRNERAAGLCYHRFGETTLTTGSGNSTPAPGPFAVPRPGASEL